MMEKITDKKIAFEIANATFDTSALIDYCVELMLDFVEQYIETEESRKKLTYELKYRPNRIDAKIFTLLELLNKAKNNLDELQEIEQ